ncbi:MAG: peptidoglycan DD-metalloendopeptidase family protein [Hyphomicrobiaceae bacterium]
MLDRRRHALVGGIRRTALAARSRGLPQLYHTHKRRPLPDLYSADSAESRRGGFRWFFSTCLAAAVGGVAIVVVIFGSADPIEGRGGMLPTLARMSEQTRMAYEPAALAMARVDGLAWSLPKSDRLQPMSGAMSTKFIVQESIRQRKGTRDYIHNKPYARIVARLGAVSVKDAASIPPFNPFRLYANNAPVGEALDDDGDGNRPSGGEVTVRVVELLGSSLPIEDGQEMDLQDVAEIVKRTQEAQREEAGMKPGFLPEGLDLAQPRGLQGERLAEQEAIPPYTTVLAKTAVEGDDAAEDLEGREVRKVKVARGDTLTKLLQALGSESWLARSMVEAARGTFADSDLTPGNEVEFVLVPSLTRTGRLEPIRLSVRDGGAHKVTVSRNAAGEFVASATAVGDPAGGGNQTTATSLYASLYQAALSQGLAKETIEQIIKIHAYETDFRRRARSSDAIELFFDVKDEERAVDSQPGELLFTAITTGGDTQRYFRFRTADGQIDFYDESGNNSKKFLMRRPIRSEDVRLASGFGVRFHPLLNTRKMHTGIDWAATPGTPILASGTGVIEEVGPKGQYGNYIRIRHANGYQTAYAHMSRFAQGVREGVKVRQGQVIGFVGNTGFSTGPHLHYEVLVNNRFVDPLSIQMPQERKLTGRQLLDFQKERSRLDELMRRPPVRVAQVESK